MTGRERVVAGAATACFGALLIAPLVTAAGVAGSWQPAGSMASDRSGHTATRLNDGTVLVTGGVTSTNTITAEAELFIPARNTWAPTAPMHTARLGHTAIRLEDGRVLVVGGLGSFPANNDPTRALASAELYDPADQSWSPAASMPAAAIQPTLTLLDDGRILVAGGSPDGSLGQATAALYEPGTNHWTAAPNMATPRRGPAGLLLRSGKVLVAGGAASDQDGSLDSTEVFDPIANRWSPGPSMNSAHAHALSAVFSDGTAMVAGGVDFQGGFGISVAATDLYDQAANSWSKGPPLNAGRASGAGALLSNGLFLAVGGFRLRAGVQALSSGELFDPGAKRWTLLPPMSTSRTSATVTPLRGGGALIAGGTRVNETELLTFASAAAAEPTQPTTVGDLWSQNRYLLLVTALLAVVAVAQVAWRQLRKT
jgi:hypothetical protein